MNIFVHRLFGTIYKAKINSVVCTKVDNNIDIIIIRNVYVYVMNLYRASPKVEILLINAIVTVQSLHSVIISEINK